MHPSHQHLNQHHQMIELSMEHQWQEIEVEAATVVGAVSAMQIAHMCLERQLPTHFQELGLQLFEVVSVRPRHP